MNENQALLAELQALEGLLAPIPVRVIGGLAVHLRATTLEHDDPDFLPSYDPRRWSAVGRVTRDIDIVVPNADIEQARKTLGENEFELAARIVPPPFRFQRDDVRVDLIAVPERMPAGTVPSLERTLAVLDLESDFGVIGTTIVVGIPALVVLKSVAFGSDPSRRRDLADVGRLALLTNGHPEIRRELGQLLARMPGSIQRTVERMSTHFATADSTGALAFLHVVRAELGFEAETVDGAIREQVSRATRALLSADL